MTTLQLEPIAANDSEQPALNQIKGVLNNGTSLPALVGPDGTRIELPQSVFQVLKQIVYHMMHGRAIFIVPDSQQVTTQQAADMLGVSRPYLTKLLDERKIPAIRVGTHRRILFSDLMNYKRKRDAEREQVIDELAQMSQELGIYD